MSEEQNPVAFYFQKALRRAYVLGQRYWADADSESYRANKRADTHRQDFEALCAEALEYTTPPQRRPLTEEEIGRICAPLGFAQLSPVEVARAIERAHGIGEQQ